MIGVLNCYGLPEEDNEDNYIINEEDEFEGKVGEQWLIKRRKALKDYNWGWVCFNGDIEDYEYNFAKKQNHLQDFGFNNISNKLYIKY